MLLPWSKPPSEITCPRCGAKVLVRRNKNSQFQPKPYCTVCGWNVERARRSLLTQVRQFAVAAALFAAYAWAISGKPWFVLIAAAWVLGFMGFPIIAQLRRLPASLPTAPPPQPLAGFADLGTVTLDFMAPRLNIIVEAMIILAMTAAILFLPREFDPARRRFPGARHEGFLVVLTIAFAAYQLIVHAIEFSRLFRAVWLEQRLANHAMTGKGRISDSNSGIVTAIPQVAG
jgi:predicted RNA-binding Zn-ribbon protein involved in translation (DUF1610 family)